MKYVIAVANQKGGVGKTTTAVNLAFELSRSEKAVLLIDMDPQGNASTHVGVAEAPDQATTWDWFQRRAPLKDVVHKLDSGMDVLGSTSDLTAIELQLLEAADRTHRMRDLLQTENTYEYVIIDCPPSLNILTINSLMCATHVLIPMQCEYFALEGLSALLKTIEAVRESGNVDLDIDGIVRTMYDPRNKLAREVSRQLFDHFGTSVYRTVVPRNVRLAEAPSHGKPVQVYDPRSRGAIAHSALAHEMLRRHAKHNAVEQINA